METSSLMVSSYKLEGTMPCAGKNCYMATDSKTPDQSGKMCPLLPEWQSVMELTDCFLVILDSHFKERNLYLLL